MKDGRVWSFKTRQFRVSLILQRNWRYQYDGDDPEGETQAKLNSGEYVAFDSRVEVEWEGQVIGENHLGGSVYSADNVSEFWTAHRDPDPMNRNCSIMRANHPSGPRVSICHYFPGMVEEAISEARQYIRDLPAVPYIREGAR